MLFCKKKKKESDTKGRLSFLIPGIVPKSLVSSALKGQFRFRNASVLNGANWEDILRPRTFPWVNLNIDVEEFFSPGNDQCFVVYC